MPQRIVPPDRWPSLPVQPPSGAYRRWTSRVGAMLLGTAPVFVVGAFVADARSPGYPVPAWFSVLFGILTLECIVTVVIAVVAIRPYRAERKLGYTTWPSLAELKSDKPTSDDALRLGL